MCSSCMLCCVCQVYSDKQTGPSRTVFDTVTCTNLQDVRWPHIGTLRLPPHVRPGWCAEHRHPSRHSATLFRGLDRAFLLLKGTKLIYQRSRLFGSCQTRHDSLRHPTGPTASVLLHTPNKIRPCTDLKVCMHSPTTCNRWVTNSTMPAKASVLLPTAAAAAAAYCAAWSKFSTSSGTSAGAHK